MAGSFMNIGPSDLGFIEREQRVQDAAALRRWEAEREAARYEDQRADIEFQQQMAADMARQQTAIRGSSEARAERESQFSADMARQQMERQREVEDRSFGLQERAFAEDVASREFAQDLQLQEERRAEAAFNMSKAANEIGLDTARLENESRELANEMRTLEIREARGQIEKREADLERERLQGVARNQALSLLQSLNDVRTVIGRSKGMAGAQEIDGVIAMLERSLDSGDETDLQDKIEMGWKMLRGSPDAMRATEVMQRAAGAYTEEEMLAIRQQQGEQIAEVQRKYAKLNLPDEIMRGLIPKMWSSPHVPSYLKEKMLEGGLTGETALRDAAAIFGKKSAEEAEELSRRVSEADDLAQQEKRLDIKIKRGDD